jgi:hypothetical protein
MGRPEAYIIKGKPMQDADKPKRGNFAESGRDVLQRDNPQIYWLTLVAAHLLLISLYYIAPTIFEKWLIYSNPLVFYMSKFIPAITQLSDRFGKYHFNKTRESRYT